MYLQRLGIVKQTQTNDTPRFVSLSKYDMVATDDFTPHPGEQFRYQVVLEKNPRSSDIRNH